MDRRRFIQSGLAIGAGLAANLAVTKPAAAAGPYQKGTSPWPLCLNASTIRPTPVREKVRVAAEAGYDALELWTADLEQWVEQGGDLKDLGQEITDRGMFVANIIGLWDCMPEGEEAFRKALDLSKKRMEMAAAVGSKHIAVLPLPDREPFDLHYATEKYRQYLELGLNEFGVHPAMEFVSVFKGLRRLGEAVSIAIDADHPQARIIPDIFHLFNGGSGFEGLRHIKGELIAIFHWNDLPKGLTPGALRDTDRIVPGEGVLPLVDTLKVLHANGYRGALSLELFRREHWEMDAFAVAKLGVESMRRNVEAALA